MLIEHLFRGWTRLSGTVPDVRWRPKNCKHINRRADGSAARRSVRALRGLPEKNRAPVPGIPGLQQSQFATLAEPRPPKIPMQGSGQSRTKAPGTTPPSRKSLDMSLYARQLMSSREYRSRRWWENGRRLTKMQAVVCHKEGAPNDVHGANLPRRPWALSDRRSRRYHCDEGRHTYRCNDKFVQFGVVIATACPLQHRVDFQIVCSLDRRQYLCSQFVARTSARNFGALPALSRKNGKASFPLWGRPVRRSFRARLPHLNARTTPAMTAEIT